MQAPRPWPALFAVKQPGRMYFVPDDVLGLVIAYASTTVANHRLNAKHSSYGNFATEISIAKDIYIPPLPGFVRSRGPEIRVSHPSSDLILILSSFARQCLQLCRHLLSWRLQTLSFPL